MRPDTMMDPVVPIFFCTFVCCAGCAVERIDQIIAEHGVTYSPSSTGETSIPIDTSTGKTTDTTGASGGENTSTSVDPMTGSESQGSEADGSSSSSTGDHVPVCGDGVVEGDEDCDDGNDTPDDGCQECMKDTIVFVSSEIYKGFALGGLYGADQKCRSLAAKANLPGFETFRAWLSTAEMPVEERLIHSLGRYKLVNGLVIAADWEALTTSLLQNPIMVDEMSQTQDYGAWTGTLGSGDAVPGTSFCGDWDDDSGKTIFGAAGLTKNVDATWSFFDDVECGTDLHIYCVEQ